MTKEQLAEWKQESIEQAYKRLAEEMKRVVKASGEVH